MARVLPGRGYQTAWEILERDNPDAVANSSNLYQCWEVPDPEKWIPDGYALVGVDSRGAGRSAGFLAVSSPQETQDIYECIEWLARQPWCTGKIGMNGVSYYGANQWRVAAKRPPHLAAICVWEGYSDSYREAARHGGIFCTFGKNWFDLQVLTLQHGLGDRGRRSRVTGETVCGPETLTDEELARSRVASRGLTAHPLEDISHRAVNGGSGGHRGSTVVGGELGRPMSASARAFEEVAEKSLLHGDAIVGIELRPMRPTLAFSSE
jgi:putative CocE/NonD family hydrolase